MLFHITYEMTPDQRNTSQQRFSETGGPPPANVTMIGRWHSVGGLRGFMIAETDDAVAISRWTQEWTDLLTFDVVPILDDDQLAAVLA